MDFMFEDEVDEVGSDVEAYCPKCKGDTTHVVISKYEDEIRRVQCNPCGDVHSFRKPRGDVEDDVPEPIAAKKRAMMKKVSWEEFFHKHGEKGGKPYEFREHYHDNVIVTHPKFGRGFVSEVLSDSKVEITFKDARRVLVHNRRDMPGLPLAAEGDGRPSNAKMPKAVVAKSKGAGKEVVVGKDVKEAALKDVPKDAHPSKDAHAPKTGHAAKDAHGPAHKAAPAKEAAKDAHQGKDAKTAAAKAPAAKAAPAADAAKNRKPVPAKAAPAAKPAGATRTAKPTRAVNEAPAKRTAVKPSKPTKAAKKGKK
ncbi:MAG TPA: hypothetical protein VH374_12770 [Polyangia bacterium]|jgi:hypothetical protein|nr:hypothetical protein [Polyangia bacterium]